MTPERYVLAMILFHTTTLGIAGAVAARWWRTERVALPARRWIRSLVIDVGTASVATYAVSLLATTATNLDYGRRVYLGEISGRLMGQALFGEAILLATALAWAHRRVRERMRAAACGACAAALVVVYVEATASSPGC